MHVYASRGGGPSIGSFEGDTRQSALDELHLSSSAGALAANYAASCRRPEKKVTTLADILELYEASEKFCKKSTSTKYRERRPLEEIRRSRIGALPEKALGAKRTTSEIEEWRKEVAEKQGPRAADIRVGLISKALSWAMRKGLASANPAKGIEKLSNPDRSDVILTSGDLKAFDEAARAARMHTLTKKEREKGDPSKPPRIVLATLVVCYTGLRREDACNLNWSMVEDDSIVLRPLKSLRRARTSGDAKDAPLAVIPITDELREVLIHCGLHDEKRSPWVLTNSTGAKWTPSGLTTSFTKTRDRAGLVEPDGRKKCLHDGRGTFVTHMRMAGVPIDDIAEMVGWTSADVRAIAKKYVAQDRVSRSVLKRLRQNDSGT